MLKRVRLFLILLVCIFYFGVFNYTPHEEYIREIVDLKSAGYWDLTGSRILIDDLDPTKNWAFTATNNDWCSGSGTWNEPYIIENVTINGLSNKNCLEIRNSDSFFIIQNCTFFNAGMVFIPFICYSGIYLYNVINGKIMDNTMSPDNGYGIYLESCNNITVGNNNVNYNYGMGIFLYNSDWNKLTQNEANFITNGIGISINGYYNNLRNNTVYNNDDEGLRVGGAYNNITFLNAHYNGDSTWATGGALDLGHHNNYLNCSFKGNEYVALCLAGGTSYISVKGCEFINNPNAGIRLRGESHGSNFHNISKNVFSGNGVGIDVWGTNGECSYNTFSNNLFTSQTVGALYLREANYNDFFNNFFYGKKILYFGTNNNNWNSSYIGNYWDNYIGVDEDDNGIGDEPYYLSQGIDYLPICRDGPNITIITPYNNAFYSNPPEFAIKITDPTLDKKWYTVGSSTTKYFFSQNSTINETEWLNCLDGNVLITFYANDTQGNVNIENIIVEKDAADPDITILNPNNDDIYGNIAPSFTISVIESNLETRWYTIDDGLTNYTFTGLSGVINQTAWDQKESGQIILRFFVNDSAGNLGMKNVFIAKDINPPIITINSPFSNGLYGIQAPTFNISIGEPNLQETWYSFNGGDDITFTIENKFDQVEWDKIGNGTVLISFYAKDKAGNINLGIVFIRKDSYMPEITIHSPIQNEVFRITPPNFNISIIEDELTLIWYEIEGITTEFYITECIGLINQVVWNRVPNGEVLIRFCAQDAARNIGIESIVVIKSIPSNQVIPGYEVLIIIGAFSVVSILIIISFKKNYSLNIN